MTHTAAMSNASYVLGHSEQEIERLHRQADYYAQLTSVALHMAGIQPGMRVLDAGCGGGDVSLLIARLVGPKGEVVAVDRSSEALAAAERRLAADQIDTVHLVEGDIATIRLDAPVDAVVGRLILMHVPDPVAALRNLASLLAPEGTILMQEMDIGVARTEPPAPMVEAMIDLCRTAFGTAGVDVRPGMRLHEQFLAAGLPAPQLLSLGRIDAPPARASAESLVQILTTLLPVIEGARLADLAELDLSTLASRLSDQLGACGSLAITPPLITAISRIGRG